MLEELFYNHRKVVANAALGFRRYLYDAVVWDEAAVCIMGARGTGKTTLLLQHYHEKYGDVEKCLYLSADNIEVMSLGLFKLAKEYFNHGGRALIIDEIHKYPEWQIELKNIIDVFKNKEILVSGSSALELTEGKADLSRRLVYYKLSGLSFREYLELKENIKIPVHGFEEIVNNHVKIAQKIISNKPILKCFKEYLAGGYYPFFIEGEATYFSKLLNVIEKVLYEDVAIVSNIKKSNIAALKKILWMVASSVPFCANIEKLSRDLGLSKEYVYAYLEYLEGAELITSICSDSKGHNRIRKSMKLYIENTNLLHAINSNNMLVSEQGSVRETFFVNQLKGYAPLFLCDAGDFVVYGKDNKKYTFEVGRKNKTTAQIKDIANSFVVADNVEIGYGNKIPLYLFGMMY